MVTRHRRHTWRQRRRRGWWVLWVSLWKSIFFSSWCTTAPFSPQGREVLPHVLAQLEKVTAECDLLRHFVAKSMTVGPPFVIAMIAAAIVFCFHFVYLLNNYCTNIVDWHFYKAWKAQQRLNMKAKEECRLVSIMSLHYENPIFFSTWQLHHFLHRAGRSSPKFWLNWRRLQQSTIFWGFLLQRPWM